MVSAFSWTARLNVDGSDKPIALSRAKGALKNTCMAKVFAG